MRRIFPFVAAAFLFASEAHASSEAQALFDEGKRLMASGAVDEACDHFERSQKLEPAGGTLLHLALCRKTQGRTATAYELFNQALSAARSAQRKDREQAALQSISELEPKLMRLRIVVPDDVRASGLEVARDGQAVPRAVWGLPVPVDPGAHEVVASAPGKVAWTKRIDVARAGGVVDLEVPVLANGPASDPSDAARPKVDLRTGDEPSDGATQRTLAIVALGVGVVGIGVGSVTGIMSASAHDEADDLCGGPAPTPCPQAGVDEGAKAQSLGNVSTVAFVVGAVGLVAGAVLWFTAPTKKDVASQLMRGKITF